jgi:hypothetical protein
LTLKSFAPKLLELKLSPPQALVKSKLLELKLSSSSFSQITKILCTDVLHVFITLRDSSPRGTRCSPGATKVVERLEKFILPSSSWGFDSGNLK